MIMIELHLGLTMAIGIFIIGRPAADLFHDNVWAPFWSPPDYGHLARLCSLAHLVEITDHLHRRFACSLAEFTYCFPRHSEAEKMKRTHLA